MAFSRSICVVVRPTGTVPSSATRSTESSKTSAGSSPAGPISNGLPRASIRARARSSKRGRLERRDAPSPEPTRGRQTSASGGELRSPKGRPPRESLLGWTESTQWTESTRDRRARQGGELRSPSMGVPSGSRTRVSGVKSRGPGPLDDGDEARRRSSTRVRPWCKARGNGVPPRAGRPASPCERAMGACARARAAPSALELLDHDLCRMAERLVDEQPERDGRSG